MAKGQRGSAPPRLPETSFESSSPLPSPLNKSGEQAPAAAVAVALALEPSAKPSIRIHLASTDQRAAQIGRALSALTTKIDILVLPAWDCLPFDRASPGRDIMGRRMAVFRKLISRKRPSVLLLSPESLAQRVPPQSAIDQSFTVKVGSSLDREALLAFANRAGYLVDDRIDDPGQIAMFGEVVDLYPADARWPVRIGADLNGGVSELRTYDPITQRTTGDVPEVTFGPASELVFDQASQVVQAPGIEHLMAEHYGSLQTLFDVAQGAVVSEDCLFSRRMAETLEIIGDAREAHRVLSVQGEAHDLDQGALFLDQDDIAAGMACWTQRPLNLGTVSPIPSFASARNPGRAFCDFVDAERSAGRRVVLAGNAKERRTLGKALRRGLDVAPQEVDNWQKAEVAQAGTVCSLELDIDSGFVDSRQNISVIAAADVLGARLIQGVAEKPSLLVAEPDLKLGDVVLHEDHGVGLLRELQTVDIDGVSQDTLRLEYYGGGSVLAPIEEIDRIWRYGADVDAVALDRLKGDGWIKRRAEVNRHLNEVAARLVDLAKTRAAARCDPVIPPALGSTCLTSSVGQPNSYTHASMHPC